MPRNINDVLTSLELGKHIDVFVENEIDLAAARLLTEQDLIDLGLPLGPRRKLVAALTEQCVQPVSPTQQQPHSVERRLLTIFFCDLVDSTRLSRELDAEALRDVMRRYQDIVAGAVSRYGGHVAKYLGDGVLAYFGWPQAYEDQAERSVRAALDTVAMVSAVQLDDLRQLKVRIGIATGEVVVGDLVGDVAQESGAVIGETPNLAARLQGAAEPGQIVVGENTRRLIGSVFELEDKGNADLKGFEQSIPVWRVIRESEAESRFEAKHKGRVPFVGRKHELAQLSARWMNATTGDGQVVILSGDAGVGKSRLLRALRQRIEADPHIRLSYQCSPYHSSTALHPVIQQLVHSAGIADTDTVDQKLDKLEKLIALANIPLDETVALIASLLAIPYEHRYGKLELEPQQLRARTIDALAHQVLNLSKDRTVLLVVEDVHWIDPTTETLIGEMIARSASARVLVVLSQRPEYRAPWYGHAHLTSIVVNRLDKQEATQLARAVAGDRLPDSWIGNIVEKAGGIPLYVEELTKSLAEVNQSEQSPETAPIPDTLQASLMARLDRLEDAKQIAQIGSVIGREFSHALVARLWHGSRTEVEAHLDALVESEMVFERGEPPDKRYYFKHALIQDAAYASLLRSRRKELHGAIVTLLEQGSGASADIPPETLAHHAEQGEIWEKALTYFRLAGLRANDRSAYSEALSSLESALAVAGRLEPERAVIQQIIDVHMNMRPSLGSFGEYDRLLNSLSEANRLATSMKDEATATYAEVVRTHVLYHTGQVADVLPIGEEAFKRARSFSDRRLTLAAAANLAMGYCFHGDFQHGIDVMVEFEEDLVTTFRHDNLGTTGTSSTNWLCNMAGMHANLGAFDEADRYIRLAGEISNETAKPFDGAMVAQWHAHVMITRGEPDKAISAVEKTEQQLQEYNIDFLKTWMYSWLGGALLLGPDLDRAEATLLTAWDLAKKTGLYLSGSWTLSRLAMVSFDKGDAESGARYAREARSLTEKSGARWLQIPALHVSARAASSYSDDQAKATELWHRAISLADCIGARPDLAHGYLGLGEHLLSLGDVSDAEKELRKAQEIYLELAMSHWLPKVQKLLAHHS